MKLSEDFDLKNTLCDIIRPIKEHEGFYLLGFQKDIGEDLGNNCTYLGEREIKLVDMKTFYDVILDEKNEYELLEISYHNNFILPIFIKKEK